MILSYTDSTNCSSYEPKANFILLDSSSPLEEIYFLFWAARNVPRNSLPYDFKTLRR